MFKLVHEYEYSKGVKFGKAQYSEFFGRRLGAMLTSSVAYDSYCSFLSPEERP